MKFKYSGPASGVTLADGTEVLLWPGQEVALPESEYTAALQAQGYLQAVVPEPVEAQQEAATKKRKEV